MNNKNITIGIVAVVLIIAVAIIFYVNYKPTCFDGNGYTIYIPKEILLSNLASANASQVDVYNIQQILNYTAKTTRNSCGKIDKRIIVENGTEKIVSQEVFDKFMLDYNSNNFLNALVLVSKSGNSPVFVRQYYRDFAGYKSYDIENINGTLTLTENPPTA